MRKPILKGAAGLAAAALLLATPATAAGCWKTEGAAAAKVRDLQSRLMVATLRCRAIGADIEASYGAFVRNNRETIQAANALLKAQFATGDKVGERAYDSFATALANQYGADATTPELCRDAAAAAEDAAAAGGELARLLAVADRLGPPPALPGGPCQAVSFASAMHAAVDTAPEPPVDR
ncbi:MAG: hypothetical protein JO013_05160 [Alphaproteobacteria bacterium]|nr:hypothetical protein [Alphaproteobacteria bacterium]